MLTWIESAKAVVSLKFFFSALQVPTLCQQDNVHMLSGTYLFHGQRASSSVSIWSLQKGSILLHMFLCVHAWCVHAW